MSRGDSSARSRPRKRVGVADYATLEEGLLSTSGLGSCVAVALYAPGGPGGLLHAMLPRAGDTPGSNPAKCVDSGIETLHATLLSEGARPDELAAKLAGGSRMLELAGAPIGERNVAVAREVLDDLGVSVLAEDVGGDRGRSIRFSVPDGALKIRSGDDSRCL